VTEHFDATQLTLFIHTEDEEKVRRFLRRSCKTFDIFLKVRRVMEDEQGIALAVVMKGPVQVTRNVVESLESWGISGREAKVNSDHGMGEEEVTA
jgi:hypothetical protein